jgi:hypothetical protein
MYVYATSTELLSTYVYKTDKMFNMVTTDTGISCALTVYHAYYTMYIIIIMKKNIRDKTEIRLVLFFFLETSISKSHSKYEYYHTKCFPSAGLR